jgi:hypothetical protein
MAKRKAAEPLARNPTKINTSTDFVFYESARHAKISNVLATKLGKQPIYRFFIDYNGKYFPLRGILDLASTSFVISPEAAKAFSIRVGKWSQAVKTGDVSGTNLQSEN